MRSLKPTSICTGPHNINNNTMTAHASPLLPLSSLLSPPYLTISYLLPTFYLLSPPHLLSPIFYLLSSISYLLSPISSLLPTFYLLSSISYLPLPPSPQSTSPAHHHSAAQRFRAEYRTHTHHHSCHTPGHDHRSTRDRTTGHRHRKN